MSKYIPYMLIMSFVTYAIRMLPITLFQKEIKCVFIKSFLYYVPYAVLGCMTFPAIFTCCSNVYAAITGSIMAVIFAYKEKSLLTVAIVACISVFVVQWGMQIIGI